MILSVDEVLDIGAHHWWLTHSTQDEINEGNLLMVERSIDRSISLLLIASRHAIYRKCVRRNLVDIFALQASFTKHTIDIKINQLRWPTDCGP